MPELALLAVRAVEAQAGVLQVQVVVVQELVARVEQVSARAVFLLAVVVAERALSAFVRSSKPK